MSDSSITICEGCGVVVLSERSSCDSCGSAHADGTTVVGAREDGLRWARLEASFLCRSCGFAVALNHLDLDGACLCSNCGIQQAFSPNRWHHYIDAAHLVADLAGPVRPAENNPVWEALGATGTVLRAVGSEQGFYSRSRDAAGGWPTLRAAVRPGQPVCSKCRVPVEVEIQQGGSALQRCPKCDTEAVFELPEGASSFFGLRAALAPEHQVDRPAVEVLDGEEGAAVAINCPSCHAPLEVTEVDALIECRFCNTVARIPANVWKRAHGKPEPVRAWWLLFEGPCEQRTTAEKAKAERDQKRRAKVRESWREHEARQAVLDELEQKAAGKARVGWGLTIAAALLGALLVALTGLEVTQPQALDLGGTVWLSLLGAFFVSYLAAATLHGMAHAPLLEDYETAGVVLILGLTLLPFIGPFVMIKLAGAVWSAKRSPKVARRRLAVAMLVVGIIGALSGTALTILGAMIPDL